MNRYKAFAIHLSISVLIVLTTLTVVLTLWYPNGYFIAEGGWNALKILIFVDLVAGPVLTLIVFKPHKWGLRFDLTVIALLQLSALMYGITVLYTQRPAYLVFNVDRFDILSRQDIDMAELDPTLIAEAPKHANVSLIFAERPTDDPERTKLLEEVLFEGKPDLQYRPEYYRPFTEHLDQVFVRELATDNLKSHPEVVRFLSRRTTAAMSDYKFLPVVGKNRDMVLAIRQSDGTPQALLKIDPYADTDVQDSQTRALLFSRNGGLSWNLGCKGQSPT